MATYTIEDIELIRRKSGISYQEAVALLDYHNGNVARALVDLERNGRIDPDADRTYQKPRGAQGGKPGAAGKGNAVIDLLTKAYRARIKVSKDATPVLNLSVLFSILSVLISPHLVIIGVIVCLILGYKFSFEKNDADFAGENLERMVRSAADNVKSSVSDFAKGFQSSSSSAGPAKEAAPENAAERSYYARPAAQSAASATYRPSAPTLNVPVQVESQDGNVTIEKDSDGYSSATVE